MADPYIGEIRIFAGTFAPRGWAFCDGRLLDVAANPTLFSVLGTTYGGDGAIEFALPDLRGRAPMHAGSGDGLTPRTLGETGGSASATVDLNQIPEHTHPIHTERASSDTEPSPIFFPAISEELSYGPATTLGDMHPGMMGDAGGGVAHENRQPFLALNFIIALDGLVP